MKYKEIDGVLTKDKEEIANTFCKYLSEIGGKLADQVNAENSKTGAEKELSNSIFLSETDPNEIAEIIHTFKNKKSPGIDNISTGTLELLCDNITAPISYITN
ncbi:hypothetical protein JTB14_026626 [Gonioctena quinquepunctata]|nr:hypothetical protein JTB14_026626 [Gonioctena quinquepunctata]